jgi:hypothetical protein
MTLRIRKVLLVVAFVFLGATACLVQAYRCRTLVGRSDIILCGRMIDVSADRRHVMIDVIDIFKGRIPGGGAQRLLVDIVPRWDAFDIMPPWPAYQTNKVAVFFLRKSIWSSSYKPIFIKEKMSPIENDYDPRPDAYGAKTHLRQ